MKEELLEAVRGHLAALTALNKAIKAATGERIQSPVLLAQAQAAATMWFDSVRPALHRARFPAEILDPLTQRFDALLRSARARPRKAAMLAAVSDCMAPFKDELIHNIEVGTFAPTGGLSIEPYIEGLTTDEGEYLAEAQLCLSVGALRGCIVLGWCAVVARIHSKIGQIGYDQFSKATADMAARTTGKFKFFKKKQDIENLSDLQRVFDTDLLWVLEYMGFIDGNQHQRLRHCFEFRNNSAHPGLAPIKGENLYSFYSDISEIVLKNPKFAMA